MGKYKLIGKINGIIYIHDSNDTARVHFNTRMTALSEFFGQGVFTSSLIVFTKYDDLKEKK